MIDRHLMKLRARDDISLEEEAAIRASVSEIRRYPADETIVHAGVPLASSMILLSGIVARAKDLRDGRRQITELHTPGDFTDLHSFTLKYLEHDVLALSDCQMAIVPHDSLRIITERHPHLTRVYWFTTNLDAAIHREWELSLGRRTAIERVAHLFCELHIRLGLVGLVQKDGYALPLNQTELAECMGLSTVHANRTLMQLRRDGLVDFQNGRVTILDLAGLREVAEFDPAYLYLARRSRPAA